MKIGHNESAALVVEVDERGVHIHQGDDVVDIAAADHVGWLIQALQKGKRALEGQRPPQYPDVDMTDPRTCRSEKK